MYGSWHDPGPCLYTYFVNPGMEVSRIKTLTRNLLGNVHLTGWTELNWPWIGQNREFARGQDRLVLPTSGINVYTIFLLYDIYEGWSLD